MASQTLRASILAGLAIGCLSFSALHGTANAQTVPTWINYQGRLTSPIGAPVTDGPYVVTFKLYAYPTGGSPLWTEQQQVATRNGVFSVTLGKGTPFPTGLFVRPLFLELSVADKVLMPRQELASVPFAMTALTFPDKSVTTAMIANLAVTTEKIADGAVSEAKLAPGLTVPVGTVVAWWGNPESLPAGWQVCDGSAVSDSASPLKGSTLPDLRGRFIRGASGSVRPAAPTGGQDAIDLRHTHAIALDGEHRHELGDGWANIGYGADTRLGWQAGPSVNQGRNSFQGLSNVVLNGSTAASWQTSTLGGNTMLSGNHNHGGATGSALSEATAIIPKYVALIYIVRVR